MKRSLLALLTLFSFSYAELDKDTMQIIRGSMEELRAEKHPINNNKKEKKRAPKVIPDADFVNGIAVLVNDVPITLHDISSLMNEKGINKPTAATALIDKALYESEIVNQNITVDIFDIDQHIEKLAQQNNMNILDFKSLIREQEDYSVFKKKIKDQLTHQKLLSKIAKGKLKIANEKDLQIYYDNNQDEFKSASKFTVMAYVSKNKRAMQNIQKNPMYNPADVVSQSLQFDQSELTPQVKYILNNTKNKSFSIIFPQNGNYNMFFVKDKSDIVLSPFEEVKEKIFGKIMKEREQDYLKEYFETLKITADIRVLR